MFRGRVIRNGGTGVRVIVVGAGEVGFDVARMLSSEGHDVVVIERDPDRLAAVREKLDVMAIQGNGAASETLKEARVDRTDMMIAVTTVDEVNIIACMMADRLGVETTIARIRSDEYTDVQSVLRAGDFGIDFVIHPEESAAEEAARAQGGAASGAPAGSGFGLGGGAAAGNQAPTPEELEALQKFLGR